jgi:GNAT superfamily N-acetyltransferase
VTRPGPLTDRKLERGWPAATKTRFRAATAADIDAIAPLAELAGAPFEQQLRDGIADGTAGAGLRTCLRDGHDAYTRYMAQRFTEHQRDNPILAYTHAALVLVAEHRDTGVVGALIAYPPLTAAAQIVDRMKQAGYDERERYKTILGAGMFLTRIKAVAVAEHARGHNLGGSLLKRAKQVYDQCHYEIIYGAMPEGRGLDAFYDRAGFTVHDPGTPLDLFVMFGRDTMIWPGPGERLFSRQRPH